MRQVNSKLLELAHTTGFSYDDLEEAAIEYGAQFVGVFADEAFRSGANLLSVVRAVTKRSAIALIQTRIPHPAT